MPAPRATPTLRQTCGVALALVLAAIVPALLTAWLHPRAPAWTLPATTGELTWQQARALPDPLWIDARPATEFAAAHLPGALSLPATDWDSRIETILAQWSPGRPVIVYCGGNGCQASHEVARRLRDELGLSEIHVLAGGWPTPSTPAP